MSYGTHDIRQGSPGSGPRERDASPNVAHRPATPAAATTDGADDDEETESVVQVQNEGFRASLHEFYERNFGLFLVFAAQTFGSVMNTAAKLLTSKDAENPFHALHIIFVRMLATSIIGLVYMWYKKVPDSPFGPRNMVPLLVLRGSCGFVGLFGLYYSLTYLEISDATAISFLVPTWTAILCYVWLREPYRFQEAFSGIISLAGVLLIARPTFLFGSTSPVPSEDANATTAPALSGAQRTFAVLCSILGTFAAATAYSTIRVIGKRVHSLISVNYFAMLSTVGSGAIILIHPDFHFVLPQGTEQWLLLVLIGVSGFLLQFLLTEGLQREKGGRATNVTYFQMVLVLIIERVIWGTTPPLMSLIGSALIIAGAIWLSLQKPKPKAAPIVDEETSLLGEGRRQADE